MSAVVAREDRELLARLAQVNSDVPDLAMRLMSGELPVREQRAFALRLVDAAEALMAHADRRDQPVIDQELVQGRPPRVAALATREGA